MLTKATSLVLEVIKQAQYKARKEEVSYYLPFMTLVNELVLFLVVQFN